MKILVLLLLFLLQINTGGRRKVYGTSYNACLVSGWPMNEGSGLTLHDVTSNANTYTLGSVGAGSTAAQWQTNTGFSGTTLLFKQAAGASAYGSAASTSLLNFSGTQPFSVAAWIYTTNTTSEMALVSTLNVSNNYQGWELQRQSNGNTLRPAFFLINSYPSNAIAVYGIGSGGVGLPTSSVVYVSATYDGSKSASGVHIYVNGVEEGAYGVPANSLTSNSTGSGLAPKIGARSDGSDSLDSVIADVAVYNCVPSTTFWSTNYAKGPGIY
jgi:hypothetical protein